MKPLRNAELDKLFNHAVSAGASDLHLAVGLPPMIRVDGTLKPISGADTIASEAMETMLFSILTDPQKEKFQNDLELDMSYEIDAKKRFRVNLQWSRSQPGLVARVVPPKIPSMEDLMMPEIVYELCRLEQGLILVTGPTGCGKSTSLATMIELLNNERNAHIITLEDPIEFVYESKKCIIKQRQLGTDMLSFANGLKHILRQDPNIILVGEMRDLETIASTITLAETGHLVFATLHTFNAGQTVDRIIDVFPPYQQEQVRLQLSLFLKGIISQRLLPKKDGGRIAAREILVNTPAIGNLIRENKIPQIKTAIQTSANEGMFTMDQHLKQLYERGYIEKGVAVSHMVNPAELQ